MMMRLLIFLTLLSMLCHGQNNPYQVEDSLINTGSMINSMTVIRHLKARMPEDSTDSEFWLRYAKASFVFYRYEDARTAMSKAITISPNNPELHYERGVLYNKFGDLNTAIMELDKAVALKPVGKYFYWRGIVNQQLHKSELAEEDYKKAIEYKFNSAELYNNLAILLSEHQKFGEALSTINKAIRITKNYGQAYSTRSQIYLFSLNIDSACIDATTSLNMGYKNAVKLPDSVCKGTIEQKLRYAAEILATNGAYEQSIRAYTKLIEQNFESSDYFLNRGYCYFHLKAYDLAEKDYLKALSMKNPMTDMIYDNLSLLYNDQEMYSKAIDYSTKRIELNPRNHVAYLDRGYCLRKSRKYKEAEKDFSKSLELKPDFFRAYGYRSFLFFEIKQYDKSYTDALKAVELNPEYSYGYIVLAQVKMQLGLPDYCADLYKARQFGEPAMAEEPIAKYCK